MKTLLQSMLCFAVSMSCYLSAISQSNTCFTANPFCSSNQYNFPNATTGTAPSAPEYGCLYSVPNPIWYYMEIGTSGTIDILLQQTTLPNGGGSQIDVDFAMWGPFTSLNAGCQAIMAGNLNPIQCSYSSSYSEDIGLGVSGGVGFGGYTTPPAAVAGQVYIVLLTNYAEDPGFISFNQTGGTGSADCSIIEPCSITNFTANLTNCITNTANFSISGVINVVNPPSTGQLVVRDCDGNESVVASAPFNSASYNYYLGGLMADGSNCSIEAFFTAKPECSSELTYISPECPGCGMTSLTTNVSECTTTGTYDVAGQITFVNAPTTGSINVATTCGGSTTFTAPFTSPLNYTISGLTATGANCAVYTYFTDNNDCQIETPFTAPTFITPTFNPIRLCLGETPPNLPTISIEGIAGTWATAGILTNAAGTSLYTFTPNPNQCAAVGQLEVEIYALPDVTMPSNQVLYECATMPSVSLTGTSSVAGVTYQWTGNGPITNSTTASATAVATGVFTLTVTNPVNGCVNSGFLTVIGNDDIPVVSIDPPLLISCDNPTINLTGNSPTPGTTFVWEHTGTIASGESTLTPTVSSAGTYTLSVTAPNECSNFATVVVEGNTTIPVINTMPNTFVINCNIPLTSIDGNAPDVENPVFTWTGPAIVSGQSTANILVNGAGTYQVSVLDQDNNCVNTASYTVTGNTTPPVITIAPPASLHCNNSTVVLSASTPANGVTTTWTGPGIVSNGNTLSPTVNAPGSYVITVTDPLNFCSNTATTNVNMVIPVIPSSFDTISLCANSYQIPSNQIVANGDVVWSSLGGNGTFNNVNALAPLFTSQAGITNYTLTFVDTCGLSASANLTLIPKPQITSPLISCDLGEYGIQVTSESGGTWHVNENASTPFLEDTTLTFEYGQQFMGGTNGVGVYVSQPGIYTLTFNSNNQCPDTTISLNFISYIYTEIGDTLLCNGMNYEMMALEPNSPVSYLWSDGSVGNSIMVSQPGTYHVAISNACYTYTDSAVVTYEFCDIEAPNVISLSSKEGNNLWFVDSKGIADFECIIVNRWGTLIYQFNDVNASWNGRDMGGRVVSEGTYFYTIKAKMYGGDDVNKHGFIQVVH